MTTWKTWLAIALLLVLAYLMYPKPAVRGLGKVGNPVEELTLWVPSQTNLLAMQTACEQFERLHGGKYRVLIGNASVRDDNGDATRFLLGVAGRSPPDLIDYDRFAVVEAASRGAFLPLNDLIARD